MCLLQLIGGKHPIISRVSTIQGGAGFFPSTVCLPTNIDILRYLNHEKRRHQTNHYPAVIKRGNGKLHI